LNAAELVSRVWALAGLASTRPVAAAARARTAALIVSRRPAPGSFFSLAAIRNLVNADVSDG
jgi:hypothetical protein